MKNLTCTQCGAIVLEVEGQYEKLDSYYLSGSSPPSESVGYWHTSCLKNSSFGPQWHDVRVSNHIAVRGYREVASTDEWSVIRHPRTAETLAFSRRGESLTLTYPAGHLRRTDGGAIYRVAEEEYNLHLEDQADVIRAIQQALTSTKTFPLPLLFELLGIQERVSHPEALERGVLRYQRSLHRDWDDSYVAANWEYGVFVPAELEQYVTSKKAR